jgi:transposase
MSHLTGESREQLRCFSLEGSVPDESLVRVIDRFIEIQNFSALGFCNVVPAETGRPSYPPKSLAKLYVYGYENGIRSSRKLERETLRNLEVMWLTNELKPDYKTIAEFRKNNLRPLQKRFREFVKLCRSADLIGGGVIAFDGAKIKASNNKKNNFSRKKLEDRIARLDAHISEYLEQLDKNDVSEKKTTADTVKLFEYLERKEKYEGYLKTLDKTGENELSVVDPDARLIG